MKTTLFYLALVFGVGTVPSVLAEASSTEKGRSSSPYTNYEYKILGVSKYAARQDLEEELNRLGKLGWKIEAVERVVFGGMRDTLEIFLSRKGIEYGK